MSELAHAKIGIGKLNCITYTNRLHSTRPIGRAQPSCVRPDWWWYSRRNGRGEAVGDVPRLVHAQCVNGHQTNETGERADDALRTIGWAQTSCATPERQQILWQPVQGGVVDKGLVGEHVPSGCLSTRAFVVSYQEKISCSCMYMY